jgi:hypothetical protein
MSLAEIERWSSRLPDGYVAVPVTEYQTASPLRVCVLVRREADPVSGHLVTLRDMVEARVMLGCVCDAADRVKQWVEIWVQDLEGLSNQVVGLNISREALTNRVLDERWRLQLEHCDDEDFGSVIRTGWEEEGPCAIFIDVVDMRPFHPPSPTGSGYPVVLCRDDALLMRKRLPMYSMSLHRYLYQREMGEDSLFWPATEGAPTNEYTKPMEELKPRELELIPLNPSGGLMMVRTFSPFGLNEFIQQLGGSAWQGLPHGKSRLRIGSVPAEGEDAEKFGGWMFLERHGRNARFVEVFHLKVRCLLDLVTSVRALVRRTQRPLLNLRPESFQIVSDGGGAALPVLWTCRPKLVDPGDAITLKIPSGDVTYFLPARNEGLSIFQPSKARELYSGRGEFQIRRFPPAPYNQTIIEGVFHTREHIVAANNDMVWFRLHLKGKRVDLYAKLEPQENLAEGELRFRTIAQRFDESIGNVLQSAEGVPLHDVNFEIVPLLSSPCDLYSLGVLAIQILLLRPDTTLAECIGDMTSLCRKLAANHDANAPLQLRIQAMFADNKRFQESLGPQKLVFDNLAVGDAARALPEELWWETLATVVRMFPGLGPDSICTDLGHAPMGGIHRIFDPVIADLQSLVNRSRSLLMVDWNHNREVHAVLKKLRSPEGSRR